MHESVIYIRYDFPRLKYVNIYWWRSIRRKEMYETPLFITEAPKMTKICGVASSKASAPDMLTERSDLRISAKVSSDEPVFRKEKTEQDKHKKLVFSLLQLSNDTNKSLRKI